MFITKLLLLLFITSLLFFTTCSQEEDLEIVEEPDNSEFLHEQ